MLRKATVIGLVSASLLVSGAANAACVLSDLAGTWQVYSASADNTGAYWTRCKLIINSAGTISNSSTCTNEANQTVGVTNGSAKLTVPAACTFTSTFKLNGVSNRVVHGTIANVGGAKVIGTGVGSFNGGAFIFTMTKL